MNRCTIAEHELPSPTRILSCHTATHYMGDLFMDPLRFDIDRYLPERQEHLTPSAYVPYGLGRIPVWGITGSIFKWQSICRLSPIM
ncbi:MAG: cytochrome P450 [Gammaproteobacteria bacterium]|nr:cytochrome P450 [Gammaproteobacteria bacterium]